MTGVTRFILLRGTTLEREAFTPLDGELIWDSDEKEAYVGNGTTAGGINISTITPESIQDIAGAMVSSTDTITTTYNNGAGTLAINVNFDDAGTDDASVISAEQIDSRITNNIGINTYHETSATSGVTYTPGDVVTVDGLSNTITRAGTYKTDGLISYKTTAQLVNEKCLNDLSTLVTEINALSGGQSHDSVYGSETLTAGVYDVAGATTHTGVLTFDAEGDADATFVMRCGAAHAVSISASSVLINGAQSSNIFWRIIGAPTIGATCTLKGTYIATSAWAPGTSLGLDGRLLTTTGAIGLTSAVLDAPTGTSTLNVGFLSTFLLVTGAGAVSNTVRTGATGDISTGSGTVTGFSTLIGDIYLATDSLSKGYFQIFHNTTPLGVSLVNETFNANERTVTTSVMGINTVSASDTISVRIKIEIGTIDVSNRSIFSLRLGS